MSIQRRTSNSERRISNSEVISNNVRHQRHQDSPRNQRQNTNSIRNYFYDDARQFNYQNYAPTLPSATFSRNDDSLCSHVAPLQHSQDATQVDYSQPCVTSTPSLMANNPSTPPFSTFTQDPRLSSQHSSYYTAAPLGRAHHLLPTGLSQCQRRSSQVLAYPNHAYDMSVHNLDPRQTQTRGQQQQQAITYLPGYLRENPRGAGSTGMAVNTGGTVSPEKSKKSITLDLSTSS